MVTLTPGAPRLIPATWELGQLQTIAPQNRNRLPSETNAQIRVKKEENLTTGVTRFVN